MKFLLTAALLLPLTVSAQSPAKRPMTFADLQAMKHVGDPQISPSGKWVMFSVGTSDLAKNTKVNHLWIVPITGATAAAPERQLTDGGSQSNGRFSPDGKLISYTADAGGKSQIYVATFDDATGTLGTARTVTAFATEADGAIWAPDSEHLLFVSSVYPACQSFAPTGPERNDGEALCNSATLDAEQGSPVKAQLFTSLLYRHWNAYTGERRSHVFYAEIPTPGAQPAAPTDLTPASVVGDAQAPTFSLGGPLGYAIAPDGKEIAYEVNLEGAHIALYKQGVSEAQRKTMALEPQPYPQAAESTNNDIFVLQLGSDPSRAMQVSTSKGSDDGPQYSPDGKWLAWRSQARDGYESDKFNLVVMDRATGNIRNMTQSTTEWVDEFAWSPDSKGMLYATSKAGEVDVIAVNLASTATRFDGIGVLMNEGELGSLVLHDRLMIGTQMRVDHPAELFVYDFNRPGSQASEWAGERPLTHLNDSLLAQLDLPKMDSFWFPSANGDKVQGFLIRPPGFDPAKKYPVKFLIHGGPQGAWGDAWSYRWNPELFAADGYVVVMVNPHGSTGYGQKFVAEVSGDWGGLPYTDLMRGLDYAEAHYSFIDKSRECALGASYGGFMADWILTHTHRFACIVTHDGMADPVSAFGTTEEMWFNEWEFQNHTGSQASTKPAHPWDFYNKPASEDPFRKWSPMLNITYAKTPTLIVHGQRDYRLDISQGLELFTALQLRGVPSEMLYYPDEGHWVLKPQNSQLWYQTVNAWCARWTGKADSRE
jgi:dipeptidyl aminopeptidase/acylaminoacyl peptidase